MQRSFAVWRSAWRRLAANAHNKVLSAKFVKSGSPAVAFLKGWNWTNDDQNLVAKWIAGDHMDADKAAEKWAKGNPAKVKAWLGK
jgi:glycine betaine/proline transport system substrate-binding protein